MHEQDRREEDKHDEAGRQVQKDLSGQSHCLTRFGVRRDRLLGWIFGARLTLLVGLVLLIGSDKHTAEKFTQLRQQNPVHRDAYETVEDHQDTAEGICRRQIAISCIDNNN